jgi:uncharacterized protein YcgL (UPF0745 family)
VENIYKKQQRSLKTGSHKLEDLIAIIYRSTKKKQIYLIGYPETPE